MDYRIYICLDGQQVSRTNQTSAYTVSLVNIIGKMNLES